MEAQHVFVLFAVAVGVIVATVAGNRSVLACGPTKVSVVSRRFSQHFSVSPTDSHVHTLGPTHVTNAFLALPSDSDIVTRSKRSDRVRCGWTNGFLCRWSCRAFGHSDGSCDEQDECICSEEELERYVCRGDVSNRTADALCAGWCQFKGLQTGMSLVTFSLTYVCNIVNVFLGDCNLTLNECECSTDKLQESHAKCITDEVCAFYCQFKEKKANGKCVGKNGWDCVCYSSDNKNEVTNEEN